MLLLIGATTVFGELQDALDRIWRAPARDRTGGLWGLLRARLLSFGMILGIAFLLMVSLVLSAAVAALGKWWRRAFGGWELLAQVVNLVLGFVLTTGVFAMIYKIMPRVRVQWRDVWIGAVVTALLFTDRALPDRPVHRQERRRLGLRRRRLAGRRVRLGLLLGADLPDRRRVHLGLCNDLRLDAPADGKARRQDYGEAAERSGFAGAGRTTDGATACRAEPHASAL